MLCVHMNYHQKYMRITELHHTNDNKLMGYSLFFCAFLVIVGIFLSVSNSRNCLVISCCFQIYVVWCIITCLISRNWENNWSISQLRIKWKKKEILNSKWLNFERNNAVVLSSFRLAAQIQESIWQHGFNLALWSKNTNYRCTPG